jgi:hypothetical protein
MGLLDNLAKQFSKTSSDHIGLEIEELVNDAIARRKTHERRWFDNNFFDDGYHFKAVSRKTGKVLDHVSGSGQYVERAIPRASRQIRGVTNLLFAAEPYPVVYPERITIEQFRLLDGSIDQARYQKAMENAKQVARKQGMWLSTEWEEEQDLPIKLIDAILLAAKNSISWIQVYSDTEKQKIKTDVYDAFDVIILGDRREAKDLPFITKSCEMDIEAVKNDTRFEEEKLKKLSPDNRYATSEIKEAYMRVRFGSKNTDNKNGTIIVKETFMKEYLTQDNWEQAVKLGEENGAMEGKSKGDMIMRHPFSAAGVTLRDEYIDYEDYPLVPIRFEPGPLYQVPFIERFIPQNKSIDVVVTRLEKWINAMVTGIYMVRKGENFQISNLAGGQKVEYETTPPQQMNNSTVGNTPFNVIELLNKYIDEQGATTSGGMNVPAGVKSGVAIESVKATEYANLKIPIVMLKKSIKEISERMLERGDKDILEPQEYSTVEDGEPQYFDVIGQRGMELSQKINKKIPQGVIPIKRKVKVRIEMEPGLGLTMEGKKEAMQQIIDYMLKLADPNLGLMSPEPLKMVIKRFMETFGYGSTQEFMEAMDEAAGQGQMTENSITQMKIAMVEALKDAEVAGPAAEQRLVDSTKVGVLEAMKDSGILDKKEEVQDNPELDAIPYKDAPEDIKRQMEQRAGLQPSQGISPAGDEQIKTKVETKKIADTPIIDPIKQQEVGIKARALTQKAKPLTKKSKVN